MPISIVFFWSDAQETPTWPIYMAMAPAHTIWKHYRNALQLNTDNYDLIKAMRTDALLDWSQMKSTQMNLSKVPRSSNFLGTQKFQTLHVTSLPHIQLRLPDREKQAQETINRASNYWTTSIHPFLRTIATKLDTANDQHLVLSHFNEGWP